MNVHTHTNSIDELSSVGIATGAWQEFDSREGQVFSSSTACRPAQAHPASYPMATVEYFPGDKEAGT
jgi:hypothetical protein